ncbi:MAG TPA: ribonuclease HI [Deltaproteobacteria bacterium]|nr:MAG: ribonuclease HI [Deltaproteobacteria bacterium]HDM77014.1 ribonuclease HI [Deltaproteobacteria bacterium]
MSKKRNNYKKVEIFTDGACQGNPGPGGWAAILKYKNVEKELSGAEPFTTNNRMELTAVIEALKALKEPCKVTICTDSQYVQKGISEWLPKWKQRKWLTSTKNKVKNVDLWKILDREASKHHVTWKWVRGHSGIPQNERCDYLAKMAIENMKKKWDK